jgi:N-acetylglucosamine PTS system EIICBA or EIICB component
MIFAQAQRLGRALMLPIAVLPVAGLLLRLGQPDLIDAPALAAAGKAIFDHLALLFAIGVAVGFAHENHGVAGLSGAVGYFVMDAVLEALDKSIEMGVMAGIIAGLVAGTLYNRTRDIRLPEFLSFFGGKRFAAIATGFTCLALAFLFWGVWPPIQRGIDGLGGWLIGAGALGLFVYGVLNRLLIVTGLHHILNTFIWFAFGSYAAADGRLVHGDLHRFFAGDPTAGYFMAGFFPILMFGLPAAMLAMVHAARPENRKRAGGVLLSSGLTSMATGVTEPAEFSFMFHAPLLYGLHALLTGAAMAVMYLLGVRLGFTFSAGAFDALLSSKLAENGWLLVPVGLGFAVVYYLSFRILIARLDLKTPGREAPGADSTGTVPAVGGDRAQAFVAALGGGANLLAVDACTTRLRLSVVSGEAIDEAALARLGAKGVVRPAKGSVQVVLGPEADQVADEIKAALRSTRPKGKREQETGDGQRATGNGQADAQDVDGRPWIEALGGAGNIRKAECVATTRVRVEVLDASRVDEEALEKLGASGVMQVNNGLVHIIAGTLAPSLARALAPR